MYLGACCNAGLPLLLFQAVQLAAQALVLLAVQTRLGTTRIQRTTQLSGCSSNVQLDAETRQLALHGIYMGCKGLCPKQNILLRQD